MPLAEAKIIQLPKIADARGNLTFIEGERHVSFPIRRVYYLYDVPGGERRGGHAHRELEEFIVAVSGSFRVVLDDGVAKASYFLNRSYSGLFVPRMVWRELEDFSSGSVCMVLASRPYDEDDYIRDHGVFSQVVKSHEPHQVP